MPGLEAKEGDGNIGFHRDAAHKAAVAIDATGHINGHDRAPGVAPPAVEPLDNGAGAPVDIAREARAEQRVDGEIGAVQIHKSCRADTARPGVGGEARVAGQFLALAEQADGDFVSHGAQQAGSDEAVAAVITGPAENNDTPARRQRLPHRIGHGCARVLHQLDAGNAARNRQPVGLRHLRIFEKFDRFHHRSIVRQLRAVRAMIQVASRAGEAIARTA